MSNKGTHWKMSERGKNNISEAGKRYFEEHPEKKLEHSLKLKIISKEKKLVNNLGKYAKKGIKKEEHPFYGKHHSEESKKKIGNIHRGIKLNDETKKKISKSHKGKHNNEKNYFWKGGISKLCKRIRILEEYREWLSSCMTRDNWTCQTCGKSKCALQVHHKKSFASILKENNIKIVEEALNCKELWNIDNGITLCLDCHKQTDTYLKRI